MTSDLVTRNCSTCGHRLGTTAPKCQKTGFYCDTQRKYPTNGCDVDFSGWVPRMAPGRRLWIAIFGVPT